jgi:hypothetical protein
MHAMNARIALPLSIMLLGLSPLPVVADSTSTRDACNTWLATGVRPQGITRADCNFARDAPQGSILRGGTSDTTHVWRLQGDYQKRFVIDTGSEQKQQPQGPNP